MSLTCGQCPSFSGKRALLCHTWTHSVCYWQWCSGWTYWKLEPEMFSLVSESAEKVTGERGKWALSIAVLFILLTETGWTLRKGKQTSFSFKTLKSKKTFGFENNDSVAEAVIGLSLLAENLLALGLMSFSWSKWRRVTGNSTGIRIPIKTSQSGNDSFQQSGIYIMVFKNAQVIRDCSASLEKALLMQQMRLKKTMATLIFQTFNSWKKIVAYKHQPYIISFK